MSAVMEEGWVEELRREFPVAQNYAFFDVAYENCGANFLRKALEEFFDAKADIYPGIRKAGGAGKGTMIGVIAHARELCAQLVGASSVKNIAFTKNTNEGINIALHSYAFQEEDTILTSATEYSSVLLACLNMKRFGVSCKVIENHKPFTTAEEYIAAMDEHTRMVVVSFVQSATGYQLDLKKLSAACRERGAFLIVDVIQALGLRPVDVNELGIDLLTTSGYKGLLATEGLGFLCCSDRLLPKLWPAFLADNDAVSINAGTWEAVCLDPMDARKFENGTISFPAIYALEAALSRILAIGVEKIYAHVSSIWEKAYQFFREEGFEIITPWDPACRCGSLVVYFGDDNREAADFLLRNGVFLSPAKNGCVRVSVGPWNTTEDVSKLAKAVRLYKDSVS